MDRKTALSDLANIVLEHTRIEEVIGSRLQLTKRGNRYVTCCPFHQEKTPSFHINTQNQFYYCFGCKANGNAINFLREYEKLTFVEALTYLARQAGITLPNLSTQTGPDFSEDMACLAEVTHHYQQALAQHAKASNYLKERGIHPKTQAQFALGYATDSWDNLLKAFHHDKHKEKLLKKNGLLIEKEDRCWDRFRDRIMFPIRNPQGKTIAFGGRTLCNDRAKYLNSPQTPLFNKKAVLYGVFELLQTARQPDYILVVEGYMDVIALHQMGVPFAVATLGTANNQQHLKTLQRYTKEIIYCFDGDTAGQQAAWHALEEALPMINEQITLRFFILPKGEDPDSYISKHGKEAFLAAMKGSLSFSDFFFNHLEQEIPTDSIDNRARFAKKALHYIERMPQGMLRQLITQALADRLSLSVDTLIATPQTAAIQQAHAPAPPKNREIPQTNKGSKRLNHTLSLILQHPSLANSEAATLYGTILKTYEHELNNRQRLFLKLLEHLKNQPDSSINRLITDITHAETRAWLAECSVQPLEIPDKNSESEFHQSFSRLTKEILHALAETLIGKAKQASLGDQEQEKLRKLLQTIGKNCIN